MKSHLMGQRTVVEITLEVSIQVVLDNVCTLCLITCRLAHISLAVPSMVQRIAASYYSLYLSPHGLFILRKLYLSTGKTM